MQQHRAVVRRLARRFFTLVTASFAGAALFAAPAAAQCDLFPWSLIESPTYPFTSLTVSGDTLTVNGPSYPDPCFQPGADGYGRTTAPFDATVSVHVLFIPDDFTTGYDEPIYVINGVVHDVSEASDGREVVFHVKAGDQFGFGNHSYDCLFGSAVSVWSQLRLFPEPKTTVTAGVPSENFGAAVARLGDVDGDGVSDVAVGAPHAGINGEDSGRVVVLSGADGTPLFAVAGLTQGEQLGASVAGAGDLNGDGVPDLVAGAPFHDNGPAVAAGRIYAISGAGGAVLNVKDGVQAGEHFGQAVANAGDLDGDAVADVIAGAPDSTTFGAGAGLARACSGATLATLLTLPGITNGHGGTSVAGAGDLNGDGVPELLVGAPTTKILGVSGAGAVRVHSGASGLVLLNLVGDALDAHFGFSVAGLPDLDDDGVGEIAVGEPAASDMWPSSGKVHVYSGATGAELFTSSGGATGDSLGFSVAAAGDTDGDGKGDILVGAPGSAVLPDPSAGTARIFSGRDFSLLAVFAGEAVNDGLGTALAGAGDLDGDTQDDVIVGAPGDDAAGAGAGSAATFAIQVIWTDLGGGVAGTLGKPTLKAKGLLVLAGPLTLSVANGKPSGLATLVVGLSKLGAPFKGGVLWPSPDVVFSGLPLNASGAFSLGTHWPGGVPAGVSIYLQAWIADAAAPFGFSATNGLKGLTP